MKTILLSILTISTAFQGFSQLAEQSLDHNNVNATISNSGQFFNDPTLGAGYEVPKAGGIPSMYAASIWFSALDSGSNIYTCLGGVPSLGTDIDQGPYSSTSAYSDLSYDEAFMITLCQEEIDNFKLWWECSNGTTTTGCDEVTSPPSATLSSIYDWPGNGDPTLGQSLPLAPFYDRNGDGIYDPINQGDYPIIKGCCATYMIQNDVGNTHTYSGTDPIGIEIHYMFYQFGASTDLYNTTFVDVLAINKGTQNYTEFACSFMADGDLGNGQDDYFGSDSTTNTMIFYNSDNLDEGGFLDNPPAIGVVALEQPSTSIMSYGSFPATPAVTWNLMNGLQPNGVVLQDPSGNTTKFLVNGDPNDPTEWNETSAGYIAGDRRGLNTTKIDVFNPGDSLLQTYAIVYSEGGNHLENASNVISLADWAKTFYDTEIDNGCEAGGTASNKEITSEMISIYPNPSSGLFTISAPDAQLKSVEIIDLAGKQLSYSKEIFGSTWTIDLAEKATGVYIIQVKTDVGRYIERLVIE